MSSSSDVKTQTVKGPHSGLAQGAARLGFAQGTRPTPGKGVRHSDALANHLHVCSAMAVWAAFTVAGWVEVMCAWVQHSLHPMCTPKSVATDKQDMGSTNQTTMKQGVGCQV